MTKPVDGAEALANMTRPIIGIENRSAQEAFDIMADQIRSGFPAHSAALVAENERLERELAKRNRRATDRQYMIDALVQMLGPKGLQVWKAWQDQGAERVHTTWGLGSAALSGEERAQVHLDLQEAIKTAVPINNIDGDTPQIDIRELAARTALENNNG